jgi:hypothetical protein
VALEPASSAAGQTAVFGRRAIATLAVVDPVTGPKPFDFEVLGFRLWGQT